jgi:hypothetical protein
MSRVEILRGIMGKNLFGFGVTTSEMWKCGYVYVYFDGESVEVYVNWEHSKKFSLGDPDLNAKVRAETRRCMGSYN